MPGVSLVCARIRSALSTSGRSGTCTISLNSTRTHFRLEALSGLLRVDGLPMVRIQPDHDQRSFTSSLNVCFFHYFLRGVSTEMLLPTQVPLLCPVLRGMIQLDHLRGSLAEVKYDRLARPRRSSDHSSLRRLYLPQRTTTTCRSRSCLACEHLRSTWLASLGSNTIL